MIVARSLLIYGCFFLLIGLLIIHFKAKSWQPFTWAFVPGVAANALFYIVVWLRDGGHFVPPSNHFINDLSTIRIVVLLVPALLITFLKLRDIWTGRG